MAESAPTIEAQDYFAAPVPFSAQNSNTEELGDFHAQMDANGNYQCSQEYNTGDGYRSEYNYCHGGSADIDTDMSTWMTTFASVFDSKVMTGLNVHFEAGIGAMVTVEGHQHDANPHTAQRNADVSGIIPAAAGVGVPVLITVAGTASPVSADISFEANHFDKIGADGGHWHGQNVGPVRVSISVQYEGQITGATAGSWLNIKIAKSNPNDDTPTSSLTAEQYVDFT